MFKSLIQKIAKGTLNIVADLNKDWMFKTKANFLIQNKFGKGDPLDESFLIWEQTIQWTNYDKSV